MKQLINFIALITLTFAPLVVQAEESDITCSNSVAFDLAYQAKQEYEQKLGAIPGVIKIGIETCSETESFGVTSDRWQCGVYLWFSDDNVREVFHQTTGVWGGKLQMTGGQAVPICSRTAQQVTTKDGPF
jgi:hypothetical protein